MKNWDDIKAEFEDADLFLGNGFSIAIHEVFKYDNLYSQFETRCSIEAKNLFTDFGTKNFEQILNNISITRKVNIALGIPCDLIAIVDEVKQVDIPIGLPPLFLYD